MCCPRSCKRRFSPSFHSAKGCKADVLVQDIDLNKPNLAQQVQLKEQRTWRVFLLNVGKDMVPVALIFQASQICTIALLHEALDCWHRTLNQIKHPEGAARPQCPVDGCEDRMPLLVCTQVMEHRSSHHNVVL